MMDPRVPLDDVGQLLAKLRNLEDRINKLEAPAGTSIFRTVDELRLLVTNIQAQLDTYNANRYTNAQIDSRVTNPGLVGNVVSTGSANFTNLRADGGLASIDVYNRTLSGSGGTIRATWTHPDGTLGYLPSSRRFKTDIKPFAIDLEAIDDLVVSSFYYMAKPPYSQESQPLQVGLIAEMVDALGLTWLVDYDEEGKPFGVRYEFLALALIPALQASNARLAKRGFREKVQTIPAFSIIGNVQEVQVTWETPFADADYIVQVSALAPNGIATAVNASPVPGTRTAAGVRVRLTTNGIVLGAGTQLTTSGVHL